MVRKLKRRVAVRRWLSYHPCDCGKPAVAVMMVRQFRPIHRKGPTGLEMSFATFHSLIPLCAECLELERQGREGRGN